MFIKYEKCTDSIILFCFEINYSVVKSETQIDLHCIVDI